MRHSLQGCAFERSHARQAPQRSNLSSRSQDEGTHKWYLYRAVQHAKLTRLMSGFDNVSERSGGSGGAKARGKGRNRQRRGGEDELMGRNTAQRDFDAERRGYGDGQAADPCSKRV